MIDVKVSHLRSIVIGLVETEINICGFPFETSAVDVIGLISHWYKSVGEPSRVVVPLVILCGKNNNLPFWLAAVNLENAVI